MVTVQDKMLPEATGMPVDELDIKVKVKKLPQQYFEFISNRAEHQQVGTLLTVENLKSLRRYANTVQALPRNQEDIKKLADFETLKMDVTRVYSLYEALHRHVDEWEKLERQIKELGPQLELFADALVKRGASLLEKLESSDVFVSIAQQKSAQGIDFVSYELSGSERLQLSATIEKGLTGLLKEIEGTNARIADVDSRAEWFSREIGRELRPRMKNLLQHIDEKLGESSVADLRTVLDELDTQIAELKRDYDANVGYAFTGLLLGPVGLIVTGGVFGHKAEEIRASKNALIEKRRKLADELGRVAPAKQNFENIHTTIRDLEFRSKDVSVAAKRLADVWLFLHSYAKSSISESTQLGSSRDVDSFVQDFSEVIKPWERIGNISHQLSDLFNGLLEEYNDV